jgi:hypothetical protein
LNSLPLSLHARLRDQLPSGARIEAYPGIVSQRKWPSENFYGKKEHRSPFHLSWLSGNTVQSESLGGGRRWVTRICGGLTRIFGDKRAAEEFHQRTTEIPGEEIEHLRREIPSGRVILFTMPFTIVFIDERMKSFVKMLAKYK